jgi:hypothetical protein
MDKDMEKTLTGLAFTLTYLLVLVVLVMDTIYWSTV